MNRLNSFLATSFSLALLLLTFTNSAGAATEKSFWSITPEPAWGSQVPLSTKDQQTADASQGSRTYHIVESHHNYAEISANTTFYKRIVYQINNTSGLDTTDPISIKYNPQYEHVEIHQLRVHRRGEVIDRLQKGEIITRLPPETQLDAGRYDDHETLHLRLDDQRSGDTIEYSYSIIGDNPIHDNRVFGWNKMQAGVSVGSYFFRLRYPDHNNVRTKVHSGTLAPEESVQDKFRQLTWENHNTQAAEYQTNVPSSFLATTYIQYSEFKDWQQVAEWAAPLYALPPAGNAAVKSKAFQIKAVTDNQKSQIEKAIQFVQDEVQYTDRNNGAGSYRPDAPDATLQRRFGTSDDKSLLIAALLKEIGVDAFPALVHTSDGDTLNSYLPSPDAFNHTIIKLPFEGDIYWIDGSERLQGSTLESLQQGVYHAALVPADAASGLQLYTVKQSLPSKKFIDEKYLLVDNHKPQQSELQITTTLQGSEAESMRQRLQRDGSDEIEHAYLKFYEQEFGTVESAERLQIEDNRAANIITLRESYLIDDIWQPDTSTGNDNPDHIIKLHADDVYHALQLPGDKRRHQPIAQRHPVNIHYRAVVHDSGGWNNEDTSENIDNKYFSYQSKTYSAGQALILSYQIESKLPVISVEDSNSYIEDLQAMLADIGHHLYYATPQQQQPGTQIRSGLGGMISMISNWITGSPDKTPDTQTNAATDRSITRAN